MVESDDIKFMTRCLELSSKAEGMTFPNPLVGSVVVHEGNIIGEGYHLKAGSSHAEVNAIDSVPDKSLLGSSTLYVNLEPCSHWGKTPPCADYIVRWSIPRVVIGTADTSEKVAGRGVQILKKAGCEVITGVAEEECRWINRRFITFNEKRRPYIVLKWAQSADGFLDILRTADHPEGPNWITGNAERILVHRWRSCEQSILAGAGTVRADNPKLNVREWKGHNPLRLVLSSSGSIPPRPRGTGSDSRWVVFTHNREANVTDAEMVLLGTEAPAAFQVARWLYDSGIQSVLIEGGSRVLAHFIENDLWDEARIFTGKAFFRDGIRAPEFKGRLLSKTVFSGSSLEIFTR